MMNPELGAKLRPLRFAAVISCLVVGGFGYYRLNQRPVHKSVSVPVAAIEKISALGRLEPDGEVINVFAPTSIDGARVEALKVRLGDVLRQGDIIAILDTNARREASLREAEKQVEVTLSRLAQVQAGAKAGDIQAQREKVNQIGAELTTESASQQAVISRIVAERDTEIAAQKAAVARMKAEVENALLEDKRYQALFTEGAVSESVRDSKHLIFVTTQKQLQEAQANLARIQSSRQQQIQEAKINLERIISSRQKQLAGSIATLNATAEVRGVDVEAALKQIEQARAGVARARAELATAVVKSPQDGQVLKIHTRPGELVGTQGIISLGQTKKMVAVAEVYELDISKVKVGQSATVTSKNNAFSDVLHGKVVEVGLEINKKDVLNTDPAAQFDARVVEVKVELDASSSYKVAGLTNLSIQVAIDVQS